MDRVTSNTMFLLLFCVCTQVFIAIRSHGAKQQFHKKIATGNINRTVRVTKMVCINTPYKHTFLKNCEMEEFPNGTVGLHISVHIPNVINYVEVIVKAYYKYTTYQPFMIDWNMEYCQAARVGRFNPSHALVMKIIEETLPEFYYPCPHGNRTYTVFWLLPARLLPQSLPSGDYRLDIFYRDSSKTDMFAMQMFAGVRRLGFIG
uniref:MD-2-related lipid-recognition domain-containing protein n=1 Tax=Anopheles culicifacies TaxID=139723 RepID=A0A182MGV6_9DIPT